MNKNICGDKISFGALIACDNMTTYKDNIADKEMTILGLTKSRLNIANVLNNADIRVKTSINMINLSSINGIKFNAFKFILILSYIS